MIRPDQIIALANDAELGSLLAFPVFMHDFGHAASYTVWATSAIGRLRTFVDCGPGVYAYGWLADVRALPPGARGGKAFG